LIAAHRFADVVMFQVDEAAGPVAITDLTRAPLTLTRIQP
jgi:hypothetical protein